MNVGKLDKLWEELDSETQCEGENIWKNINQN